MNEDNFIFGMCCDCIMQGPFATSGYEVKIMPRYVDLDNPQIIKEGRDKFGNVLYAIPPDTQTADVRPVRRGRWLTHPDMSFREWDVCSVCGTGCKRREYGMNEDGTEWVTEYSYHFCPNCGADMKGGDAE